MKLIGAIIGLIPALLVGVILFLINPLFGVLWTIWIIGCAIYAIKFKK